jgi:hypothetical protein
MICDGDTSNSVQYIGGLRDQEPTAIGIHELSFAPNDFSRPDIVTVKIRLLATLETPTYYVAVGRRL